MVDVLSKLADDNNSQLGVLAEVVSFSAPLPLGMLVAPESEYSESQNLLVW